MNVDFEFDVLQCDMSQVATIWRTYSSDADTFISPAVYQLELVFMKQYGRTTVTLRGPETLATRAPVPENAEFFGITFALGTFMPQLPMKRLVDSSLEIASHGESYLSLGVESWELPTFENADVFAKKLVKYGVIATDPLIEAVAKRHEPQSVSPRTIQRRFLRATGISYGLIGQITRAQKALELLETGVSILDTVQLAGYADQPHLTRSLKRFTGHTPARVQLHFG